MTASSASPAAAFLGFAAGDALGATVEFMTRTEITARHGVHREMTRGGWLRLPAGAVTDDTEMSLTLGVDADVLANLGVAHLARGMQVTDVNPLAGIEGRADPLRRLGRLVASKRAASGSDRQLACHRAWQKRLVLSVD